jgi:hypothetical protein
MRELSRFKHLNRIGAVPREKSGVPAKYPVPPAKFRDSRDVQRGHVVRAGYVRVPIVRYVRLTSKQALRPAPPASEPEFPVPPRRMLMRRRGPREMTCT